MANTNVLLCPFDVLRRRIEFAVCDATVACWGPGEGLIFACSFCFWFGGISRIAFLSLILLSLPIASLALSSPTP